MEQGVHGSQQEEAAAGTHTPLYLSICHPKNKHSMYTVVSMHLQLLEIIRL